MFEVIEWDDLSDEDKSRAEQLFQELQELFNKYPTKKEEACSQENSTSGD